VRPRRAEGQTVKAPPKCQTAERCPTRRRDAIRPSARRAVAELPKLRRGRPLGAGAETKMIRLLRVQLLSQGPGQRKLRVLALRTCESAEAEPSRSRCVLALLPLPLSLYV
jgi:hypothetical protein